MMRAVEPLEKGYALYIKIGPQHFTCVSSSVLYIHTQVHMHARQPSVRKVFSEVRLLQVRGRSGGCQHL